MAKKKNKKRRITNIQKTSIKKKNSSPKSKIVNKKEVTYNVPLKKELEKNKSRNKIKDTRKSLKKENSVLNVDKKIITQVPKESVFQNKVIEKKPIIDIEKKENTSIINSPNTVNSAENIVKQNYLNQQTVVEKDDSNYAIKKEENISKNTSELLNKNALPSAIVSSKKDAEKATSHLMTNESPVSVEQTYPDSTKQEKILRKSSKKTFGIISDISYIAFNTLLIAVFIILLIGLIKTGIFGTKKIIYICAILIFLGLIAIINNRYISGKIFTIILSTGMLFSIYKLNYTYDFIRALNTKNYEYKTYYVVAFNNSANKSIYNINNKKVGLLKENSTNVERMLNTKLDEVNYIVYENSDEMYKSFYGQSLRAVIVSENEYKYLCNEADNNNRNVIILYQFDVNAKKE